MGQQELTGETMEKKEISLADYLPADIVDRLAQARASDNNGDDKPGDRLFEEIDKGCGAFLEAKIASGTLAPVMDDHVHRTPFASAMRALVENDESDIPRSYSLARVKEKLCQGINLALHLAACPKREGVGPTPTDSFETVCRWVDAGDFPRHFIGSADTCAETGLHLWLVCEKWRFRYAVLNGKKFVPAPTDGLQTVRRETFRVESGRMLASDWFRIPEFTEALEIEDRFSEENSLNSTRGRINTTLRHLDKKVVHVECGNSCPVLFRQDTAVIVAREGEEGPEAPPSLGRVCCDLWWTTILEEKTLVDIVSETTGDRAKAEEIVAGYLETADNIVRFDMEPGDWILSFHGSPWRFEKEYDPATDGLDTSWADELYFVMARKA